MALETRADLDDILPANRLFFLIKPKDLIIKEMTDITTAYFDLDPKTRGSPHSARATVTMQSLCTREDVGPDDKVTLQLQLYQIQQAMEIPDGGGQEQLATMFPTFRIARTFKGGVYKLHIVFGADSDFVPEFKKAFLSAFEDTGATRRGGRPQRSIAHQRVQEIPSRR
jgi:hypothetical protein